MNIMAGKLYPYQLCPSGREGPSVSERGPTAFCGLLYPARRPETPPRRVPRSHVPIPSPIPSHVSIPPKLTQATLLSACISEQNPLKSRPNAAV
jgi:hypothetical protein